MFYIYIVLKRPIRKNAQEQSKTYVHEEARLKEREAEGEARNH